MALTVLVPAHNEGTRDGSAQITETLQSLRRQSSRPDRVVVIADNCVDDTVELALAHGAEVFVTEGNVHKKAGALNQWLDLHVAEQDDDSLIMVMDADSVLDESFLTHAGRYLERGYQAVGGVFLGKTGGGFVGMLQRNEYARYARDVARKRGRTLVLTGTATVFTVRVLKHVKAGRLSGAIPDSGGTAQVYDTKALTEDNELTFAIQHLGHRVIAPPECSLLTEVMPTWGDLWRQRYRWKRGAVENNWHYGFTRYTIKHWALQIWGVLGILVTGGYLVALSWSLLTGHARVYPLWLAVTLIFALERVVTVRSRGPRQMVLAGLLVVEMPYDICLQVCQARAIGGAILRTERAW